MIILTHFPNYRIYICQSNTFKYTDSKCLDEHEVVVSLNRSFIKGILHIKVASYHYLETLKFRNRWIRDPNYRYLGFLLMEDQVNRIINILSEREKDTTIILTKKTISCKEINLEEGEDEVLSQLAMFRLKLEKEKLLK